MKPMTTDEHFAFADGEQAQLATWEYLGPKCQAVVERVLAAQGDAADTELVTLQQDLAAANAGHEAAVAGVVAIEELLHCLELCRSALEHHEETAQQHGRAEMHRHLYHMMRIAIRTLAKHRGALPHFAGVCYWERAGAFLKRVEAEIRAADAAGPRKF